MGYYRNKPKHLRKQFSVTFIWHTTKKKRSFTKKFNTYNGMKLSVLSLDKLGWVVKKTNFPKPYRNLGLDFYGIHRDGFPKWYEKIS